MPKAKPKPTVRIAALTELMPHDQNANEGTARGRAFVEDSLRRFGAGRSILVDRVGRIIAGNTTHDAAVDIGVTEAVVVPTDGTQLVVVQRTDIDLASPTGQALAVADNRASEVGLAWNSEVVAALVAGNPAVAGMWTDIELATLLAGAAPVPKFVPETDPPGALDEPALNCVCPACGHRWHVDR